jgi:hypothetical protein
MYFLSPCGSVYFKPIFLILKTKRRLMISPCCLCVHLCIPLIVRKRMRPLCCLCIPRNFFVFYVVCVVSRRFRSPCCLCVCMYNLCFSISRFICGPSRIRGKLAISSSQNFCLTVHARFHADIYRFCMEILFLIVWKFDLVSNIFKMLMGLAK